MLIKINDHQWIESKDIYLIDKDKNELENELYVYINQHPKIPVIIQGDKDILSFTTHLNSLYEKDMINGQSHSKNDKSASKDVLEQSNIRTEN